LGGESCDSRIDIPAIKCGICIAKSRDHAHDRVSWV
jgi:hypothetical protein